MSGIAGIYSRDGRPVDQALLKSMTDVIAHRGPDGVAHWVSGPVGLGHRMFCTTPESLHEKQPLTDDAAQLCLTFDGRVDNREELKSAVEAKGLRLRDDTDAELVLRAYQCWGKECPGKILGDFAFAIWDGHQHELFCARDILGIRPFYHYVSDGLFLFASELRQILEDPRVPRRPNEGMVGEYLASQITSQTETLYQGILRLRPAHALIIRSDGIQVWRYWSLDPALEIRHRTDEEYADHFLGVFREAVRCRLRAHGPIGAELSGGVDSSSVVAVCSRLLQEGLPGNPSFHAFSLVFPDVEACNEVDYAQEVATSFGLNWHQVRLGPPDGAWYAMQARRLKDFPGYPNGYPMDAPLYQSARAEGCHVLLTGFGGDEWFWGSSLAYADMVRHRRCGQIVGRLRADCAADGLTKATRNLLTQGCWPLLPAAAQRLVRVCLGKSRRQPWLNTRFAQRIRLDSRVNRKDHGPGCRSLVQAEMVRYLARGDLTHEMEIMESGAASAGVEYRHPFDDRRVIAFAGAIPASQLLRNGQPKFVLRNAMQSYLPEKVRLRAGKADFSHLFAETLETPEIRELFSSLQIAANGWVEASELARMHSRMSDMYHRADSGYYRGCWELWMAAGIELWYRTTPKVDARRV